MSDKSPALLRLTPCRAPSSGRTALAAGMGNRGIRYLSAGTVLQGDDRATPRQAGSGDRSDRWAWLRTVAAWLHASDAQTCADRLPGPCSCPGTP